MTPGRTSLEAIISDGGITLEHAQLDQLWASGKAPWKRW